MIIGIIKEDDDRRVAITPDIVKRFKQDENIKVFIENNLTLDFSEQSYKDNGAEFFSRDDVLSKSDAVFKIHAFNEEQLSKMKKGALAISHMDPYNNKDLVEAFNKYGVNSISMEMIPRTTIAQKMDALSSQASLAGYKAVIKAAELQTKVLPMMMTPAGTISPARVFVIGVGVAGLQAIATAKRLGARVEAYDTRPVVEEQVLSLGAKFVKVDIGETSQTKDGYAKELTKEQLELQIQAMKKSCVNADIVITTAKLFGRKSPIIVTEDILKDMKHDSIIIDLAAATGGNVDGTVLGEIVKKHGVTIVGLRNIEEEVTINSSQMYSTNLYNLFTHIYDKEKKVVDYEKEDEILQGCLINYNGELVNPRLKDFYGGK